MYKELREHLDKLSLFAGSNPLVSCTVACDGSKWSSVAGSAENSTRGDRRASVSQ